MLTASMNTEITCRHPRYASQGSRQLNCTRERVVHLRVQPSCSAHDNHVKQTRHLSDCRFVNTNEHMLWLKLFALVSLEEKAPYGASCVHMKPRSSALVHSCACLVAHQWLSVRNKGGKMRHQTTQSVWPQHLSRWVLRYWRALWASLLMQNWRKLQ